MEYNKPKLVAVVKVKDNNHVKSIAYALKSDNYLVKIKFKTIQVYTN
jgi:hypothetical protein